MLQIPSLVIPTANGTETEDADLEGGAIFSQMLDASLQGSNPGSAVEEMTWKSFQSKDFGLEKLEQDKKIDSEVSDSAVTMLTSLASSFSNPTPIGFSDPASPDLSIKSETELGGLVEKRQPDSHTIGELEQQFGVQVKALEVFPAYEEAAREVESPEWSREENHQVLGSNQKKMGVSPTDDKPRLDPQGDQKEVDPSSIETDTETGMEVREAGSPQVASSTSSAPDEKSEFKSDSTAKGPEPLAVPFQAGSPVTARIQAPEMPSASTTDAREQIAPKISQLASQGGGKITVSLHPPELGKVELEVLTRGRKVEVRLLSESAATKEILQSSMADLRTSLASQQLDLVRTDVKWSGESSFSSFSSNSDSSGGLAQDFHSDSNPGFHRGRSDSFAAFSPSGSQPSSRGEVDLDRRLNIRI